MINFRQTLIISLCANLRTVHANQSFGLPMAFYRIRGGDITEGQSTTLSPPEANKDELSLDEKVQKAMEKLGLTSDTPDNEKQQQCEGGVCEIPPVDGSSEISPTEDAIKVPEVATTVQEGPHAMAERIATEMGVTKDLAMAALGATGEVIDIEKDERKLDEISARKLIQQELDLIANVSEDQDEVKDLVSEGYEIFHARRALAFSEGNMEDARAILEADRLDAAEEERKEREEEERKSEASQEKVTAQERASEKLPEVKAINVDSGFDPTASNLPSYKEEARKNESVGGMTPPPPAKKSDVVFEATTSEIQDLVLESPVPVLLDAYADWCGPCKALTPVLEEMAVKGGGAFRLVKVNTDNERAISTALEVTALPTVFAIRDGKILNNFQGMPRDEEMFRNFLMGLLMPGDNFNPPVSLEQKAKFAELSRKLSKTASAAGFSFAERELLQTRMAKSLDNLVDAYNGDMLGAEESAKIIRSLLSNIIRDPYDTKYRRVNLQNKKIAALISKYAPCISILKNVGFVTEEGGDALIVGKEKKVINVSSFTVARDCIDKWIDRNRHKLATANRKRKDEQARLELAAAAEETDDEDEEEIDDDADVDTVLLKVRIEGKKKVHEVKMHAEDPLRSIFDSLPFEEGETFQITCVAKRLIVKSSDEITLSNSFKALGLSPSAALVIQLGDKKEGGPVASKLKERALAQKNLKKGSHTMQSIGVYAKDDNAKGELVDGGGGVLYEQDVTDDEEEGEEIVQKDGDVEDVQKDDIEDVQEDDDTDSCTDRTENNE